MRLLETAVTKPVLPMALSSRRAGGDRNPDTVRAHARERSGYRRRRTSQLRDYYRVVLAAVFPRTE
jgi:hypothetical protein